MSEDAVLVKTFEIL